MKYLSTRLFRLLFTKSGRRLLLFGSFWGVLMYTNPQAMVDFYDSIPEIGKELDSQNAAIQVLQFAYRFSLSLLYLIFISIDWSFLLIPFAGKISLVHIIGFFLAVRLVKSFKNEIVRFPERVLSAVTMRIFNFLSGVFIKLGRVLIQFAKSRSSKLLSRIAKIDYCFLMHSMMDDLKYLMGRIGRLFYR